MSKFDYDVFSNEETSVAVFNSKRYIRSFEEIEKMAKHLLELESENVISFISYIEYGFYTNFDGERLNGWHIRDLNNPVEPKKNSVNVIVFKGVEWYG